MTQVCELVQRDSFTQSLQTLGLLDPAAANSSQAGAECQRTGSGRTTTNTTPKQQPGCKVSRVQALKLFVIEFYVIGSVNHM